MHMNSIVFRFVNKILSGMKYSLFVLLIVPITILILVTREYCNVVLDLKIAFAIE